MKAQKLTPNQTKVLSILSHGPYPWHLFSGVFPFRGKVTPMSDKSAAAALASLLHRGIIEEFCGNDSRVYLRLKKLGARYFVYDRDGYLVGEFDRSKDAADRILRDGDGKRLFVGHGEPPTSKNWGLIASQSQNEDLSKVLRQRYNQLDFDPYAHRPAWEYRTPIPKHWREVGDTELREIANGTRFL